MKTIVLSNVSHFYLKKKKKEKEKEKKKTSLAPFFVDRKVSFRNFFKSSSSLSITS